MSAPLDAAGGPAAEGAADLLVAAGVVAAVPTAAAGLNDWSDTAGPETRVGLVHAAVNTTALSLYLASLVGGPGDDCAAARRWAWPGWGCCRAAGTWEGTYRSAWAWMSTAPRGSSGRASGRRCWPTPNWPMGSSAGPTRAAYRSSCAGQTERCMPRPAPALTWAARCRRTQSAMAASPAHGPAAPSGSPMEHHAQPGQHARALLPDAHPERAYRGPRLHIGVAYLSIGEGRHRRHRSARLERTGPKRLFHYRTAEVRAFSFTSRVTQRDAGLVIIAVSIRVETGCTQGSPTSQPGSAEIASRERLHSGMIAG
jgi:hypothetical protein